MKKILIISVLASVLACKKDPPPPEPDGGQYDGGLVVLNEGLYQQNNASLSFYSFTEAESYQQVFFNENNRGLGDTANDMVTWNDGDSTYLIIAVDVSSQIEIINATTMKSDTQIGLFDGSTARSPRNLIVYNNTLFSCNFDGTVSVIDLPTRSEIGNVSVGSNPDGAAVYGNKLYVSNSGGLNFPDYDSTISVVNMNTSAELYKMPARINCGPMIVDNESDLYVLSRGNHSNIGPKMLVYDCMADTLKDSIDVNITSWEFFNDHIYYYDSDLSGIYRYNTNSESFENSQFIDCASYQTMYGIHINSAGIFTCDANSYVNSSTIRCYNLSGVYQYEFTAGLNAKKILLQ